LIAIEKISAARERLAGRVLRTPLIRLDLPEQPGTIYLKLENLQPIGSFKLRGALNAVLQTDPEDLRGGVVTASAGNMGQGVAWAARELGLPCTVVVPEHAPETKLAAIERLGGSALKVPYERWWQAISESSFPEVKGAFIHPVQDERVMAGNGTIGLEILEDLPDPDRVLVPFGGGGLSVGIASAVKALRPATRVCAVEPETGAPLTAAFESGDPQPIEYQVSFVDGSGAPALLPAMWPYAREALDGAFSVSLDGTAEAVRILAGRARVVAEGAGALALAAVLEHGWDESVVCVVSGGNIDASKLTQILAGETPSA
jgi:threonine dehydratase